MEVSQTYKFQAERIIVAAKAAEDERSVMRAQQLIDALPCSDNQVASYAAQISSECNSQPVSLLAAELAKATVDIEAMMALEDLQKAHA